MSRWTNQKPTKNGFYWYWVPGTDYNPELITFDGDFTTRQHVDFVPDENALFMKIRKPHKPKGY